MYNSKRELVISTLVDMLHQLTEEEIASLGEIIEDEQSEGYLSDDTGVQPNFFRIILEIPE
jgi:hypothetical protein